MDVNMMQELMNDEEFLSVLGEAKTIEKVQEVFREKGVELSKEEVEELFEAGSKKLSEEFLVDVTGGGIVAEVAHGITEETIGKIPLVGSTIKSIIGICRAKDGKTRSRHVGRFLGNALTIGGIVAAGIACKRSREDVELLNRITSK